MTSQQYFLLDPALHPIIEPVMNVTTLKTLDSSNKTNKGADIILTKVTTVSSSVTLGQTESVETTVELKERKLELQHPEATRVCSHQERVDNLRNYCQGPGLSVAEAYKKEFRTTFQSTTVCNLATNTCR